MTRTCSISLAVLAVGAGFLTASPARAGEDTVWTAALLDGRTCYVTNVDDDAIVAQVAIFDADGVERAQHESALSLEPSTTAAVAVKPGREPELFACRVSVAKAKSVRVSLCQEVQLTSGELLTSCLPGS